MTVISKGRNTNKLNPVFAPGNSLGADPWRKYRAEEPKQRLASLLSREESYQKSGKVVQVHRREGSTESTGDLQKSSLIFLAEYRFVHSWEEITQSS